MGTVKIETVIETAGREGNLKTRTITVAEYEARMKAVDTLVKVIDRKSKLLGMDALQKVVDQTPVSNRPNKISSAASKYCADGPTSPPVSREKT